MNREAKLDAARSRLAELAVKFLTRTEGDIATMRAGLARLSAGEAQALGEIRHLAHRMVGTGATMGFETLSGRALVIERLTEACTPGTLPDEQGRAELALALDTLSAELHKLRHS